MASSHVNSPTRAVSNSSQHASPSRGPTSALLQQATTAASSIRGREPAAKADAKRPKVLFMGPRSGGKSSILKVVFEKLSPSDTLFIERTSTRDPSTKFNSFVSIDLFDLPGGALSPETWSISFAETDAVIFVLDAQSSFHETVHKLAVTMGKAYEANPGIQFEIFLHKIDGMSEDYRLDTLQFLRDRLTEDLYDLSPALESSMNVFYHLTSVFDTSVFEALSKVVQKLIPEQAMLERLLDLLCQQCSMDKVFLFDMSSKIYIATDSAPLDNQTYGICAEYIDLIGDFTDLYERPSKDSQSVSGSGHSRSSSLGPQTPRGALSSLTASSPLAPLSPLPSVHSDADVPAKRLPSSKVRLGTGATIAQWGINSELSLVALVRPNVMDSKAALIDYNVGTFREAVVAIFGLGLEHRPGV